jgi:hypothetical protein
MRADAYRLVYNNISYSKDYKFSKLLLNEFQASELINFARIKAHERQSHQIQAP